MKRIIWCGLHFSGGPSFVRKMSWRARRSLGQKKERCSGDSISVIHRRHLSETCFVLSLTALCLCRLQKPVIHWIQRLISARLCLCNAVAIERLYSPPFSLSDHVSLPLPLLLWRKPDLPFYFFSPGIKTQTVAWLRENTKTSYAIRARARGRRLKTFFARPRHKK